MTDGDVLDDRRRPFMGTRTGMWVGDVVRAVRLLEVADDATQRTVFALCGLDLPAPVEPELADVVADTGGPDEEPSRLDRRSDLPPPSSSSVPASPPRRDNPDATVPVLTPVETAGHGHDPWGTVTPLSLDRRAESDPGPHVPALFNLPVARPLIRDLVATRAPGRRLDVHRIVDTIARRRPVRRLPYLPEMTLRRGVQLLIDRGVGLHPFRRDCEILADSLRWVVGVGKVRELHFRDPPPGRVGTGPVAGWTPYRVPDAGMPVLVVTDAGLGGRATRSGDQLAHSWRSLAAQLRTRGSDLSFLIPYPESRWPGWLDPSLRALPWSEHTTVRTARGARPRHTTRISDRTRFRPVATTSAAGRLVADLDEFEPSLVELAELVSPAVKIDHETLRAVRLQAAPHLGADLEADLWFSPLVRTADGEGFVFDPEIAGELRERLAQRWSDAGQRERLERARRAMEQVSARHSTALGVEQRVAWAVVSGDDDEVESELAPVVAALARGPDEALEFWAGQAAARLPRAARNGTASGWVLAQFGPATAEDLPSEPDGVPLERVMATLPRVRLTVRCDGSELSVGATTGAGLVAIDVPRTDPVVVDIEGRRVSVPTGAIVSVPVETDPVRVRTTAGDVYEIASANDFRFDPTAHCISAGEDAVGFLVAPDLVVTSALVADGAVEFAAVGPGRVVARDGALAIVRLDQAASSRAVIPIEADATASAGDQWVGATFDGSSITATRGLLEPSSSSGELEAVTSDVPAGAVGSPVFVDDTLVGVLEDRLSERPTEKARPDPTAPVRRAVVGLPRLLELLETVAAKSHRLVRVTDEAESPDSLLADGDTVWCVVERVSDGRSWLELVRRLEPSSDGGELLPPGEDATEVLLSMEFEPPAYLGGVAQLAEHLAAAPRLTDDDVATLRRFVASARRRHDQERTELGAGADDLVPAAAFQQALALELHVAYAGAEPVAGDAVWAAIRQAFPPAVWAAVWDAAEYLIGATAQDVADGRVSIGWRPVAERLAASGEPQFGGVDVAGFLAEFQRLILRGFDAAARVPGAATHRARDAITAETEEWLRGVDGLVIELDDNGTGRVDVAGSFADLAAAFAEIAPRLVAALRAHLPLITVFLIGERDDDSRYVAEALSAGGADVREATGLRPWIDRGPGVGGHPGSAVAICLLDDGVSERIAEEVSIAVDEGIPVLACVRADDGAPHKSIDEFLAGLEPPPRVVAFDTQQVLLDELMSALGERVVDRADSEPVVDQPDAVTEQQSARGPDEASISAQDAGAAPRGGRERDAPNEPLAVFVTYSRRDQLFVERVLPLLESIGLEVWRDIEDMPPSADWREEVATGIERSDAVIVVLSPDSMASSEVAREIEQAEALGKLILPVLSRPVDPSVVPRAIAERNWVDCSSEELMDDALNAIESALAVDPAWLREHSRLSGLALQWERNGRQRAYLIRGRNLTDAEEAIGVERPGWPQVTPLMREYVEESARRAWGTRLRRRFSGRRD